MTSQGVAEAYFDAWRSNAPDRLDRILAPDVVVHGPLGVIHGKHNYIQALTWLFGLTEDLTIAKQYDDGDSVVTWFRLAPRDQDVSIDCANWLKIKDGLVQSVRVAFDPRPILALAPDRN